MNSKPIETFIRLLEVSGIPHTVALYDDTITVKLKNTPVVFELRAATLCFPEHVMTWGVSSDNFYVSIPNHLDAMIEAYIKYKNRTKA